MNRIGKYKEIPFTKSRKNISIILHEGWKKHAIHALLEFDVTDSKQKIKKIRKETGRDISFTGWVIKCVAETLKEDSSLNSLKHGKNKIVTFEDVDVGMAIERNVGGEFRPIPLLLRQANELDVYQITEKIREAQKIEVDESTQVIGEELSSFEKFALKAPLFLKKLVIGHYGKKGLIKKQHMGTVGMSAIGMQGNFPGWAIPLGGSQAFMLLIGGVVKKPGVIDEEKIGVRDIMHVTLTVDHDIVDGGPMVRFVDILGKHLKNGAGLEISD